MMLGFFGCGVRSGCAGGKLRLRFFFFCQICMGFCTYLVLHGYMPTQDCINGYPIELSYSRIELWYYLS